MVSLDGECSATPVKPNMSGALHTESRSGRHGGVFEVVFFGGPPKRRRDMSMDLRRRAGLYPRLPWPLPRSIRGEPSRDVLLLRTA
jgi:hypothetical protein